ncbi:hypothetical protein J6590_015613 [Homalodisca vitripennis]|nr:hypothetical protein J6590_001331 [Homalodisca vitripennis]KAG8332785.1 hypothetical protein J6590_015613 [Homalodisca vitripennis]
MVASPLTGLVVCLLLASSRGDADTGSSAGYYPPSINAPYPAAPTAPEIAPSGSGYSLPTGGYGMPHSHNYGNNPQPQVYAPFGDTALLGLPPACAKLMAVKTYLYTVLEPLFVAFLGISAFLIVKNLVLPYLSHYARTVESEEDEDRSLGREARLDTVTATVMKALARGVCLERMACQMGLQVKDYTVTNAVIRAIDDYSDQPDRLSAIFRAAATGEKTSCDAVLCKKTARKYPKKRRLETKTLKQ